MTLSCLLPTSYTTNFLSMHLQICGCFGTLAGWQKNRCQVSHQNFSETFTFHSLHGIFSHNNSIVEDSTVWVHFQYSCIYFILWYRNRESFIFSAESNKFVFARGHPDKVRLIKYSEMSSVRSSLATAGKFAIAASRNKKLQHGKLFFFT